MGARGENSFALRAALRRLAVNPRVRDCGLRVIGNNAAIEVRQNASGDRSAWWAGILQCGRQHSCPVCGTRRGAERAEEITGMLRADSAGRWRMLTLTLQHHRGEPLADLIRRLSDAWRAVRSTRAVRALFDRYVSASARALEVTFSKQNGWHPHLHIILRTGPWDADDERTLEREWLARVPGLAGVAVRWSETPGEYIAKQLGAELAGLGKEGRKRGHWTPWQLAARALEDAELVPFWLEYQTAMHGKRMLELDERAKRIAESAVPVEEEITERWTVLVAGEDVRMLARWERHDPLALWLLLDSCCVSGTDPPSAVAIYLDDARGVAPLAAAA